MKILLAITGSIAGVKAYDAIRLFQENGYDVQCVVSEGGEQFVSRLALESLSKYPVLGPDIFSFASSENKDLTKETYNRKNNTEIFAHIEITKDIDAVVVLPASANFIANYAHGNAHNFLLAMMLANKKPVLICPAMNSKMWKNKAVQENLDKITTREKLENRNVCIVPPKQSGILACGDEGAGKLASLETIFLFFEKLLCAQHALQNKTVLINMGGTQEKIDPVRAITNISSGNTGKIIAEQCFILGAKKVICILGNVQVSFEDLKEIEHFSLHFLENNSADEMLQQTEKFAEHAHIIIFSAAVSDYTPKIYSQEKIKKHDKHDKTLEIQFSETCDIAKHITEKYKNSQKIYIGFSLETEKNEEAYKKNIKNKCISKNLDYILGNTPKNFSQCKNSENYEYIIFEKKSNSFLKRPEKNIPKHMFFRNFLASLNK